MALTAADRRRLETAKAEVSQEIRLLEEKMELAEKVILEYSCFGSVPNFNQSGARKYCFQASDWLKFGTLPRKYRPLLLGVVSGGTL